MAVLPLLAWIYLLTGRGAFWRVARQLLPAPAIAGAGARVVAVVPARNEADVIEQAVHSLLQQRYAGFLHVVVVDDGSEDATAMRARAAAAALGGSARLTVLAGRPPP